MARKPPPESEPPSASLRPEDRLPWHDTSGLSRAVPEGLSGRSELFGLTIDDPLELAPGTDLGGLWIVRLVGEGGMGRVYEARQAKPDRLVAVKVLRGVIASREQLQRFEYEAEVLGRLKHPHIAQIYLTGTHRHGAVVVPYLVMELVADARSITQYVRDMRLGIAERIAIFRRVCDAVAHGHEKGVIHRDLKPGNILVDADGDPKVIDFGVARPATTDAARASLRTQAGQLVGTLHYMSPEQREGRVDEIDARTDVYALGLVLEELVAEPPGVGPDARDLRTARSQGATARHAASDIERLARAAGCGRFAARSLATIVATCQAERPADRYATAVEVAAELKRWSSGEPIMARPPTALESAVRFVCRHRVATTAVGVGVASLCLAVVGVVLAFLAAERSAAESRAELYGANVLLAAEARDRGDIAAARQRLDAARGLGRDQGSGRPIELDYLDASLDESLAVETDTGAEVKAVAWSADNARIAIGLGNGVVRIAPAPGCGGAGTEPIALVGHEADVWRIAWSPDNASIATASGDKTVRIWDAVTGLERWRIDAHGRNMYGVAFSRDGKVVATSGADRVARLWDVETRREIRAFVGHTGTVFSVALTADGGTAVTASQDGTVRLWDVATGEPRTTLVGHDDWVFDAAVSPDQTRVASASKDGTVRIWRLASGKATATLKHPLRVNAVAFTADGRHVVSGSHDGLLRLFKASGGEELRRFRGHEGGLWTVSCSADGSRVATGSEDRTLRLWDVGGDCDPVVRTKSAPRAVAWSPDGGLLAIGDAEAGVRLYDARALVARSPPPEPGGGVHDLTFFDHGARIAAACEDGRVLIQTVEGRSPGVAIPCHAKAVHSVAVSPDGRWLATASEDGTVAVRESPSWDGEPRVLRHRRRTWCARFSPDSRRLYTAGDEHVVVVWDVGSGRRVGEFVGHGGPVKWVAVSADGTRLATASLDGTVGIWRVGDMRLVHRLDGPGCSVSQVAISPDGARVAAVATNGAALMWDSQTGRPVPVFSGHDDAGLAVAFSPDGCRLATSAADRTVRIAGLSDRDVFAARLELSRSPR